MAHILKGIEMANEWKKQYEEEQERLRQLALLCLETRRLTDEELREIKQHGQELYSYLERRGSFAWHGAEHVLRARARRAELDKLPTEELERGMKGINYDRQAFLASHDDDDLEDSAFEAPPIDSDEHIVYELLEERKKKSTTTT
jgi:hypothetical protein